MLTMSIYGVIAAHLLIVSVISVKDRELTHGEEAVCKSDAECGTEECCVGLDRKRFIFTHPTTGICQPLRYQGHACHVFLIKDPFNPNLHVNYCPCDKGLECRGTAVDASNATHVVHHDPKCLPIQA